MPSRPRPRFADPTELRPGAAEAVGLDPAPLSDLVPELDARTEPGSDGEPPSYAGYVVLAAHRGVIVAHTAGGHALRYDRWDADSGTARELPRERWAPMRPDTIFDLASVSKLFTATVATRLAEHAVLDLDAPVAEYLPEFAATDADKAAITVEQLLTHTSGLQAEMHLYKLDADDRLPALYGVPLRRSPGSGYEYSDLNLITLATVAERVTGSRLDALVAEHITGPLGMTDTGYNPDPQRLVRIAATEYQPWTGRGLIRGQVHDENAWSFGGVAGHAGVFGTARDLAVFAHAMACGGRYGDTRILGEDWARRALTNHNAHLPPEAARGLGWQLNQPHYMGDLAGPDTVGHGGYTGTSVVVDPRTATILILLANRVHPTREWGTDSAYRRVPARALAAAVAGG